MSRHVMRRTHLLIPVVLALAACQDTTAPRGMSTSGLSPRFAQGDGGVWTVNTLTDLGSGGCDAAECTLREAIAASSAGDSIVFESSLAGDVHLTHVLNLGFLFSVTIDGGGRIGLDAQGTNDRIIATNSFAGFVPVVKLARITLKNGTSTIGGGAISVFGSQLTLDSVTLLSNSANKGGGIDAVSGATVTILNSRIAGNSAGIGGGINCETCTLTISNTSILGNNATNGGGIYNEGTITLERSAVSFNTSSNDGAGIYNTGFLSVNSSTISQNQVTFRGGAIFNDVNKVATIARSTISNNYSTWVDPFNLSDYNGDGIHSFGTVDLRSTTVALNGDLGLVSEGSSGVFNATNSVLQGFCRANVVSLGHNLSAYCLSAGPTDIIVAASQMFSEVLESDLKDNGGPTKTHALIVRGRATDAGYCPGESADQRGFTRPVDDPVMPNALDACDIGAYELQGPFATTADLMVSQSVDKTSVKQGDLLTYFVRVQNLGPQSAPNVVVNDVLSSGVTFYSARSNKGTFTAPPKGETGTVTWSLGSMLSQANEVAEIAVTVLVKGNTTITNTATATASAVDPNTANNTASLTVSVVLSGGKTSGSGTGGGGGGNGGGGGPKK